MPSCPEVDSLVSLAHLVDDVPALLRHLDDCNACRNQLADLSLLKRGLEGEADVREGFADAVMAALPEAAPPAASTRATPLWWFIQAALAAATGIFATGAAGAAAPGAMASTVLVPAMVAAAAMVLIPQMVGARR